MDATANTIGKKGLRIAFLTPEYVSEEKFDGGLANYLYRVATALVQKGNYVEIFVLSNVDESIEHEGVRIHRVRKRAGKLLHRLKRLIQKLRGPKFTYSCHILDGAVSLANALNFRVQAQAFDIVQCSDFGATALALPRNPPYRVVSRLSWHAPLWRQACEIPATMDRYFAEYLERRSLRRSHFIYGPSQRIASIVAGVLKRPIQVIRPPISADIMPEHEDDSIYREELSEKRYVLFYGRVCKLKGVVELARAMRVVFARYPELMLVVVGREDPPGIILELQELLSDDRTKLRYLPRLRHPRLIPIIRGAQCVVLPSRVDNFPNACLEAMRLRQVVVGTREASFDELIKCGVNGFLASLSDEGSLSSAITKAIELDSAERLRIGAAAYESLKKLDPQVSLEQLLTAYRRAIDGSGGVNPEQDMRGSN